MTRRSILATGRAAGFCVLVLAAAGCGASPEVRFYTLSAGPDPGSDGAAPVETPAISVGPVTLPVLVDRPHLVVRVGANRVAIVEEHRWAEPLKSEIPRVVARNLAQMLGTKQVTSSAQSMTDSANIRVLMDVQLFDSAPGDAVTIDTLWTIRRASGEPVTGHSSVREPVSGAGYEAIVAAHSRALASVSREIADAIRRIDPAGAKPAPPTATAPPAPPASAPSP